MAFSYYFIYARLIFKVCLVSNRVQNVPSTLKTVEISSKNYRKSRLIRKYTPMGFLRSLGYSRILVILASRKYVKYPYKSPAGHCYGKYIENHSLNTKIPWLVQTSTTISLPRISKDSIFSTNLPRTCSRTVDVSYLFSSLLLFSFLIFPKVL